MMISNSTIVRYLLGNRDAILKIASSHRDLWLGLLFVLSAGFAREYDGENLLREPWHLLLPVAASLGSSFLLFLLVALAARLRQADRRGSFLSSYRRFLNLYWMTAPLAWLYAIPVERFLSAPDATRANLWLLAIVSLWRVVLMIRVISVLYGSSIFSAVAIVMLFADTIALILVFNSPVPVISIMGGIQLSESESIIQGTAILIGFLGILSFPIWLISTLYVLFSRKRTWEYAVSDTEDSQISPALWGVAASSLFIWIFFIPVTQSEQRLRTETEQLFKDGRIQDALKLMSSHERKDFPPQWDPPPRISNGDNTPPILDVVEAIHAENNKTWIRSVYLEKFSSHLGGQISPDAFWDSQSNQELDRYIAILEKLPEGPKILGSRYVVFEALYYSSSHEESKITETQRNRIVELLKKAQKTEPTLTKFNLDEIESSQKKSSKKTL